MRARGRSFATCSPSVTRREAAITLTQSADGPRDDAWPGTDQEIVSRISAGDVGAFERLYQEHASALLGFAYSQLRSRETAEEIVQDLFLALWRHRGKWELTRSLKSYLFGALRHRIVSHRRSVRARDERLQPADGGEDALAALPSGSSSDHLVREVELAAAIERAIEALSPRCRETFLLVRQQHLSYAEAAEVLGISTKAVEMNMVRSFASLRKQLASWRD